MKLLLKNCHIIHPSEKIDRKAHILLKDGLIESIEENIPDLTDIDKTVDLSNQIVAPGFFDMHVHLREPGREDEETVATGCKAAAVGGFTAVACMPNTEPAIDSAEVVNFIREAARGNIVDVYPVGAATLGRKGESLAPLGELYDAGAVAFSDDGVAIKSAKMARMVMEYSRMFDAPIIEHCEDESLAGGAMNEGYMSTFLGLPGIPTIAEDIIVMRDIILCKYTGARLHIAHISSAQSVEFVRQAKAQGLPVTAEVTPHHFSLTDDLLSSYDTNLKMNPPLRTKSDLEEILRGLQDGTIDCIASDHAPHSAEEKDMEFEYAPNGILGLETQIGLAFTNLYHKNILTIQNLIEKMSINPRKIFKIKIPTFEIGAIASFTILDPNYIWSPQVAHFQSIAKNSPFNNYPLKGKATGIINNRQAYLNGEFIHI